MFAIHIELNYQDYTDQECLEMWGYIEDAMSEAGFHLRGRRFFINASAKDAINLAKNAIDSMEPHQDFSNKRIYRFITEFYGYQIDSVINILTPNTDSIVVDEVDEEELKNIMPPQ